MDNGVTIGQSVWKHASKTVQGLEILDMEVQVFLGSIRVLPGVFRARNLDIEVLQEEYRKGLTVRG